MQTDNCSPATQDLARTSIAVLYNTLLSQLLHPKLETTGKFESPCMLQHAKPFDMT